MARMAIFASADAFYTTMRALFTEMQRQYPKATRGIERSRLSIGFDVTDPDAYLWVNGKIRPAAIHYGTLDRRHDLKIQLTADTLHRIMLGELRLRQALSSKALQVDGSILKALTLAELFDQARTIYPRLYAGE